VPAAVADAGHSHGRDPHVLGMGVDDVAVEKPRARASSERCSSQKQRSITTFLFEPL
jgi:hypothetical protein